MIRTILHWLLPRREKIKNLDERAGGVEGYREDKRDYVLVSSVKENNEDIDLSGFIENIHQQGVYESCAAHAVTTALEVLNKAHGCP